MVAPSDAPPLSPVSVIRYMIEQTSKRLCVATDEPRGSRMIAEPGGEGLVPQELWESDARCR
jgi:hypothetical protein